MKFFLFFLFTTVSITYANEVTEIISADGQIIVVKVNDLLEKAASLKAAPKSVAGKIVMDKDREGGAIIDPHFIINGRKFGIYYTRVIPDQWFNKQVGDIICRKFGLKLSLKTVPFDTFGSIKEMATFSRFMHPAFGYVYEVVNDLEVDATAKSKSLAVSENVVKEVQCRN